MKIQNPKNVYSRITDKKKKIPFMGGSNKENWSNKVKGSDKENIESGTLLKLIIGVRTSHKHLILWYPVC